MFIQHLQYFRVDSSFVQHSVSSKAT